MFMKYGMNRVIEPRNVLPVSAWRLDNSRELHDNELLVNIKSLHIENSNFKQLCAECNEDIEKIKEKIMDIIEKRGKLHNPITDTGGVVFGTIEKIGVSYENEKELYVGDEVICNISTTVIPIFLSKIIEIDFALGQMQAEGYAVIFSHCPLVKCPQHVPVPLLLSAFNESGSLYAVGRYAGQKESMLVVGNNMITSLLYGYVLRKMARANAKIVCIMDGSEDPMLAGSGLDWLFTQIFDEIHYLDILKPIECIERIACREMFELSVNCADIPGAETINVLATRPKGTVYFTNLINNYNIALYITENISREVDIKCADGYVEGHEAFNIQIIKGISEHVKGKLANQAPVEGKRLRSYEETHDLYQGKKSAAEDFVCESRAMSLILDEALRVSKYDCNVLIIGETGVGKEKIASFIHKNSTRKLKPMVKLNCASVADSLLESEFFGYEKGAFTGANLTGKKGFFELADNGIIFLDEIGELSMELQAKLLRVIQDGEFYKIGGTHPIKTNVRIISATNRNLEKMVEEKQFRQDLYYRLNVFPIKVPSLTERKVEIPALVEHFIDKYNKKFGINKAVTPDGMEYLKNCSWPGNIRELENMVQRLLINTTIDRIEIFAVMREANRELFGRLSVEEGNHSLNTPLCLEQILESYEKQILQFAAEKYGSSRNAASALGISQSQYIRKKNKYRLE